MTKLYVARDKNGKLYLYYAKPTKLINIWIGPKFDEYSELDKTLFPSVKWSDTEPTEVELKLKN